MIKLKELLPEKFASKAQQRYMFATDKDAAKKLASKMTKKDYENLPDKVDEIELAEKKKKKKARRDKCYYKVKRRYKVWPSAYGSLALSACRKVGAANWGEGGKKKDTKASRKRRRKSYSRSKK
jgi:hypothetical protein